MKIILTNFRCYQKKVIEFTNNSFTLIAGPSGSGKTTILMAIIFAITGKGKRLINYQAKKCEVIFIDKLKIIRSKGPERLIVQKGNEEYEHNEAQEIINQEYPNILSGYISQMMCKSFLTLGSVEKLKYIENIAFSIDFMELLNKNCKELISCRKNKVGKVYDQIQTVTKVINDLGITFSDTKSTESYTSLDLVNINQLKEQETKKLLKIQFEINRINELDEELENYPHIILNKQQIQQQINKSTNQTIRYEAYANYIQTLPASYDKPTLSFQTITQMMRDIEVVEQWETLSNQIKPFPLSPPIDDISENIIFQLKLYEKYLKDKKKSDIINLKIAEIDRTLSLIPQDQYTLEILLNMINIKNNEKMLKRCRRKLEKITKYKKSHTLLCVCPSCGEEVGLWNNKLHLKPPSNAKQKYLSSHDAKRCEEEINDLTQTYQNLLTKQGDCIDNPSQELQDMKNRQTTREALNQERSLLKPIILEEPSQYIRDIYTPSLLHEIQLYNEKKEEYVITSCIIKDKINNLGNIPSLPEFTYEYLQLELENTIHYEKISGLKCMKPSHKPEYYQDMLSSVNEKEGKMLERESYSETNDSLQQQLDILKNINDKQHNIIDSIENDKSYCEWDKIQSLDNNLQTLTHEYERSLKLQNIIFQVKKRALEHTLNQLNIYTQIYVDHFIDNIKIEFSLTNKITMMLKQNNTEIDITSLSGGEFARLSLAITLALASIQHIDLLMLDESVSSLDQDSTTVVLEGIKDHFKGTILCIAHQTIQGNFDNVYFI